MTHSAANRQLFSEAMDKIKSGGASSQEESTDRFNPLDDDFVEQILVAAAGEGPVPEIASAYPLSGYSNDLVRLVLEDGRSIMVKRSRFDWAESRFLSARRSSALIRDSDRILVPEYLDIPIHYDGKPVLAYWHIALPTLRDLWPNLPDGQRPDVVRSLGRMLHRFHQIGVDRLGPLDDTEVQSQTSSEYFRKDLTDRLKPAVWGKWSDAIPLLNELEEVTSQLPDEKDAILVHNDMHMGNILCDEVDGRIECVGLLDLEAAGGGRPESDLASASVLHSPLFSEEGEDIWSDRFDEYILEGYGEQFSSGAFEFFRAYHLLNLGFFSALNGDDWHASRVARRTGKLLNCA